MPWKRWSLPGRIGILFALTLLLQSCVVLTDLVPSYTIPGVQGAVYAEILRGENNVPYYQVLERDDGHGTKYYTYIYPGSPEYDAIVRFFRSHPEITVYDFAPPTVPGGAGTLPPPAVQ